MFPVENFAASLREAYNQGVWYRSAAPPPDAWFIPGPAEYLIQEY